MTNSLSMKKITAVAAGLAIAFSVAFVSPAKAATTEELQAQISSLLAMIATLQAQLGGSTTGGTTTGGTCSTTQFTLSHKQGDQGGDVMNIQKFLNTDTATMVATTGAGSPGNETAYFGPATKAAVIKFQNKYSSEVLAPVGLSAGTGYWGASSRAKANMLVANCTNPTNPTNPTTPVAGGVTVSAAAQPGNSLAPQSAANVPFTKFTLTAGATPVTVDSVTVELTGLADKLSFASVALLDDMGNQIGLTKTLNSNDQATIGETMTIPAYTTKTFTVAANMNTNLTNRAGEVAAFTVVAVNTSGTVAGSLPITGAQHTINASLALGTATAARGVEDPNSSQSKEIGTVNYKFQAVKITAGSAEDIRVKSVRWNQSGSASAGDLANVKLTFNGNTYTPTVSGDYYTFNFGTGVMINKGLSKEMVLSADIVGGSASTVIFDIRKDTDLVVMGETYGYGITPTATTASASASSSQFTATTPWFDGATVTVTGGSFNSVSKSSAAPAANIGELKSDEILGAFTVDIKGEPVTVETVKFAIDTTEASGSDVDADDITNITLVDQNGTVLAGPEDGNATAYTPTGGGAAEGSVSFSSITFPVGVTTVFVKGKLGSDFDTSDTVTIRTNPTDWTSATGENTGDAVTLSNSLASANSMTVKAAAVTSTTLTQPVARNIVKGVTDFIFATISFDAANSGEDVKITAMSITNSPASSGVASNIDNVEIWADVTSAMSARGDKYETLVGDAEQFDETSADTADTIAFALDQHITVPKGTSIEVAVLADVSSSAVTDAEHQIDLSSVTASGLTSGGTVSSTPSGAGQVMTIKTGGTLTLTTDSSSPSAALLLDSQTTEQTVGVFRLAANNVEDIRLERFKITGTGTTNNEVVAKYSFYNGATLLGQVTQTGATAELNIEANPLVIPADSNKLITVKATMYNIDGTAVVNGNTAIVGIAATGNVIAKGAGSGSAATISGTPTAATHTVYESVPVFTFDNTGVSTTLVNNTNHLLAKIKVTNTGDKDFTLQSGASNILKVQIASASDDSDTSTDETLSLQDEDGNVLDSNETFDNVAGEEVTFDFDGAYAADFTVAGGTSKYLMLYGDTSDHEDDGDSIQVWLDDAAGDLTYSIESTGNFDESDNVFKGDIFGPAHVNP